MTRYLGYQMGSGDLVDANWALRIRHVRERLATAASLSTRVAVKIMLMNAIMLPAVLFTVAVSRIPQWARAELHHIQKKFLWQLQSQLRHVVHAERSEWNRTRLHRRRNMHAKSKVYDEVADYETRSLLPCMGSLDISRYRGRS